MAITLFMVLGVAAATGLAGLSTALGAFLAGLLLSETEYRHQVEIDLAPFKGLLIGLFFITVGMAIDVRRGLEQYRPRPGRGRGLARGQGAILFGASRVLGVSAAVSAEVAILLAQGGEFAFIVIVLARLNDLLAAETAQLAAAVVGISMMVTPLCAVVRPMARAPHGRGRACSPHAGGGGRRAARSRDHRRLWPRGSD